MTGRHRTGFAILLFIAGFLAAGGCLELAGGQPAVGVLSFVAAILSVVTALLLRLNWRLIEANRRLLEQNARLLSDLSAHTSSLPPQ